MHIPSKEQLKKIKAFKKMSADKITVPLLMEDSSNLEAFLYSKVLLQFTRVQRKSLLKGLGESTQDIEKKLCFQYIDFAYGRADYCYDAAKKLIKNCSIENILSYLEFNLNRMLKTNIDINGMTYPEEIIQSKHGFNLSVVPTILYMAQRENLPLTTGKLLKDTHNSRFLLLAICQYHSIIRQIIDVMKGAYIPKKIDYLDLKYGPNSSSKFSEQCKYFLQRVPEHLDSIEIYNDLNYSKTYREEDDIEKAISTMKEAGAIKNYIEGKFLHVDMSKANEYDDVLEAKKVKELIEKIYGSINCEVIYQENKFTIKDLLGVIKKLIKFSNEVNRYREKNCKHICIYKQNFKNLSKQLKLSDLEETLLPLLSHDLNSKNVNDVENSPFFHVNDIYFMFAPATVELCYGKVIDKVLSQNNINVRLPQKAKGLLFEDEINNLFSEVGFEVGQIKRNHKKNIPEIDALVNFDDEHILVIEAKCTIKPEERSEVFSFVENHLSKAVSQLVERVGFLTTNTQAVDERIRFSIKQKKIIPLIVTNHSFFTGHKFVTEEGLAIYCIDEILLSQIISKNYIPSWEYTGKENDYVYKKRYLTTKPEKLEAILDPIANLIGKVHRTIQPLGSGAAIEIFKQPHIDKLEQLKREHAF